MRKKGILLFAILLLGGMVRDIYAFDPESEWGNIEVHGFISQGFLQSDCNKLYAETEDGTFQFNEFGINFSTDLTDRLRVGMQLLSRDLGDIGNNRIEIDWAYADYRWKDSLGFSAGQIKLPWGFYNETRDLDMLRTSIFLPSSLYAEGVRDVYASIQGLAIYGNVSPWFLGNINYQFLYGDEHIALDSGLAKEIAFYFPEADMQSFNVRNIDLTSVTWETPLDGLRLKTTVAGYDWDINWRAEDFPGWQTEGSQDLVILSAEYTWGNLVFAAERFNVWNRVDSPEEAIDDTEEIEADADEEGYYAGLSYRFTKWLELGAYYSVYYDDADDKDGKKRAEGGMPAHTAWQKEFVLTTRFDLNEFWTFKLEGHVINGTARIWPFNNIEDLEEESFLFAVKTTFNF